MTRGGSPSRSRHGYALALVAVAALWGATFPMVKESVRRVPPFEFCPQVRRLGRDGLRAGILAGLALFAGYAFQTVGLQYTRASNAGFVTGLFVVFAPLLAAAFLRRPPGLGPAGGVVLATVGLALLSLTNTLHVRRGDVIVLFAAVAFAVQIVVLARSAPHHSPAGLTAVQMWVAAILAGVWTLGGEHHRPPDGFVWMSIAITGVLASAAAFFVQTAAQRHIGPTRTAVILSSEPAFAGLFGFLLLGERLTGRGWVGATLILAGMFAAELGPKRGAL